MLLDQKVVAIIGGGPGGLMLARLLQLKGVKVHVYERDAHPGIRQQGATLDLHEESGLKALQSAGLMSAFTLHYRPGAGKMRVADKNLKFFIDDHATGQGYTEIRPEIDRGPLRDILIESLQPGTIIWDSHFQSMKRMQNDTQNMGKWAINFKNGQTAIADLVIAADGANSKVRQYLTDLQPVYSDITMVEGNIYNAAVHAPKLWQLTKGGKLFMLEDEKSLILTAKGDGTLTFYTGSKEKADWVANSQIDFDNQHSVFDWFKTAYAGWDPRLHELFQSEVKYIPRPMYHYAKNQQWDTTADLTLLGDAAHRMPPYAGEGVNMALLDALMLSKALLTENCNTLKEAISEYESEMLQRADVYTEMSLQNTRMLHKPGAISYMLQLLNEETS